ncbi:MAG: glycine--tRNA ligase subunit beta, partial [Planctomycetota bacterium]
MPNLLVEIGTEEIPASYIAPALSALADFVRAGLDEARLSVGTIRTDATPRRLVLAAADVADKADDLETEEVGPPTAAAYDADGKPTKALEGWLRGHGKQPGDESKKVISEGGKKQREVERVVVRVKRPGVKAADVLPGLLRDALAKVHFPKRMHWGMKLDENRALDFPRPVRYLVALLGKSTLDVGVAGLPAGTTSEGHPFLAPGDRTGRGKAVDVKSPDFDALAKSLEKAKVVLPTADRQARVREQLESLCAELGVRVDDADLTRLLPEVANLVEWPLVVIGRFDARFLDLPDAVIRESMIGHQRYFPLVDAREDGPAGKPVKGKGKSKHRAPADGLESRGPGRLVNAFATVANRESDADGAIRTGNERVIRARLSDAMFFDEEDRKHTLDEFASRLGDLQFHQALGSYAAKTERLKKLADGFSEALGLDAKETQALHRAAAVCKADLVTQMVFEFPELQGAMGGHYARHHKEPAAVADALAEHYRPVGREDAVPATRVGAALSLADKLDSLAGYFLIGTQTTGGDPLGMRRLSIGVLRTLQARPDIHTSVETLFQQAALGYASYVKRNRKTKEDETHAIDDAAREAECQRFVAYFNDRMRNYCLDLGYRHDVIDATLAADWPAGRIGDFFARLAAVKELVDAGDIEPLRELAERTFNVLRSKEVSDAERDGLPDAADEKALVAAEEKALFKAFNATRGTVETHLAA